MFGICIFRILVRQFVITWTNNKKIKTLVNIPWLVQTSLLLLIKYGCSKVVIKAA